MLAGDSNATPYEGVVTDNQIVMAPQQNAPEPTYKAFQESDLEIQFDQPLSTALPEFLKGTDKDQHYKTNFSITELGRHDNIIFGTATSRSNYVSTSPIILDSTSHTAVSLTSKPQVLTYGEGGNYVPLGIY